MKRFLQTKRGNTFLHLLGKKQLATFAAILCLMAMMPLTAKAEPINIVSSHEELTKTSTVYVGEVVVDGVSEIKYLYSSDVTLYSVVRQNLLDGLNGMADGDYADLLAANWPNNNPPEAFAFCSDATLAAAMDANWSSALYVGMLYFSDKTVASEINSNMYDIDNGFKAALDAQIADRMATIDTIIEAEKCIVSILDATARNIVYYKVVDGEIIKYIHTLVTYSAEATTVIYTKVELETPMIETPLTFEAIGSAYLGIKGTNWSVNGLKSRKYTASTDTWSDWANISTPYYTSLAAGDKLQFKKENNEPLANSADQYCSFQNLFGDCYVYGNVMSLFDFATAFESDYACDKLFFGNTYLHNHTTKELILGATTLSSCCYSNMFKGCTNLTKAPALPATSLAHSCYWGMFDGCTGLTTAPELPATTLASYCYNYMFQNCTSLTTAPELPAATLQELSYDYMFHGCTNLNYVKCFATDISAFNCTLGWLYGVAATGTFVKANGTNWTLDDPSGIPAGWTVEAIDVFTTEGDWDVAANWSANAVPTDGSDVAIMANATVPNGCMANAGNVSLYGSTLTIADGGQLIHSNAVNATLQKEIAGFGNDNSVPTGWYTIASPLAEDFTPTDDMLTEVYDLYYYDELTAKWKNYRQNAFVIEPQTGYLYANSVDKSLAFTGEMLATNASVTTPLSYASNHESLKGFNLVGNPFTCNLTGNITLGNTTLTSYYIADGTADGGQNIIACNIGDRAIKPGEGFLVQATAANQDLVFNPAAKGEANTKPAFICIEAGNDSFMDRAYVQIGYGNTLRKMSLNDNTAKVYLMQDGQDYATVTIPEATGEMPLNFKAAKNDTYTLTVNIENMDLDYLHLIDNMTGADVDLLALRQAQGPAEYTFTAQTTDYASRFRLVFNADETDCPSTGSGTFAFVSNGEIIITGIADTCDVSLQVVDVMGRVVVCTDIARNVSTQGLASGVYVLRLINGDSVKTQKIVISR